MRLVLTNKSPRLAFQLGHRSGLRSADELVEQLGEQLRAARKEIAALRLELAEERHAAATRAVTDAFAKLQRDPATVLH
jgi:hypothetical protein